MFSAKNWLLVVLSVLFAVSAMTGAGYVPRLDCSKTRLPNPIGTNDDTPADSCDVNRSNLVFEATTVDFGVVFEGARVTTPLTMRNEGAIPIRIVDVSASCGCTTVEDKPAFVLAPGEKRSITIQLNTANNIGELEKRITVFTEEQHQRFRFPITLKAVSRPLIRLDKRILDFGMLKQEQSVEHAVTVSLMHQHERCPPVYIAAVPDGVSASVEEVSPTDDEVRRWVIIVSVAGEDVPRESIDGDLVLMTPSTVESVIRIPVKASQHSFVSCLPARLNLGAIRGTAVSKIQMDCLPGHEFRLESIRLDDLDDVTASFDQLSEQISLVVSGGDDAAGFFGGTVNISYRCDDQPVQQLVVPLTGYYLASGI